MRTLILVLVVLLVACSKSSTSPDTNSSAAASSSSSSASPGKECGSRGMAPCPADEWCEFPIEAACGASDKPGACAKKAATCDATSDPVCGCDGKSYGNQCEARKAATSVKSKGACPK